MLAWDQQKGASLTFHIIIAHLVLLNDALLQHVHIVNAVLLSAAWPALVN